MAETGMDYDGAYYEEISNFQRERYLEQGYTEGTKQEVDFLLELLNLPPNGRVLDVGCGPGRHSLEFARRGFRPVGIDIAEQNVLHRLHLPRTQVAFRGGGARG